MAVIVTVVARVSRMAMMAIVVARACEGGWCCCLLSDVMSEYGTT